MYENKCVICGQPILGYWFEVGKRNVCQSCAASTTVYDLFQRDIIDMKPDIFDGEAILVTKEVADYMAEKSQLNTEYGMAVDKNNSPDTMSSKEEFDWDYVNKFELTDDIKRRVDGLYEVCAAKWEECHDKDEVFKLHERLADKLVKEYKVPKSALSIAEPAYVRSDGTIGCVPGSILMGGGKGVTNEECELQDDIENMSEDDFLSKYVDNSSALAEYQDWHKQFN